RLPASAVFHRKAAGDDDLCENRRFFGRTTWTDLGTNDTRDVILEADSIHHRETPPTAACTRGDVDAAAVTPAIGDHEPVLGDVHDRNPAQRRTAHRVRLHETKVRRVRRVRCDDP